MDPIIFKDCVSILTCRQLLVHVYLVHKIALDDQSKFIVANCLCEKETSLLGNKKQAQKLTAYK